MGKVLGKGVWVEWVVPTQLKGPLVLVFRSHDTVPDSVTSPTLRGLAQEWVAINATAEYHHQIAQMGIPGCSRPGDVLDLIDRSTSEVANELLYNLVVHDSYLSSRMVLQALLPRVLNIACGRVVYSGTLDDHIQTLVKGHGGVPVGGHGISLLADSSSPCLRSVDLPVLVLVQGDHPASGGGFGQA